MSKDKFDDSNNKNLPPLEEDQENKPILGQIGIEEFFVKDEAEEELNITEPMENQIGFDDLMENKTFDHDEAISSFFDEEEQKKKKAEFEELLKQKEKTKKEKENSKMNYKDDDERLKDFDKRLKEVDNKLSGKAKSDVGAAKEPKKESIIEEEPEQIKKDDKENFDSAKKDAVVEENNKKTKEQNSKKNNNLDENKDFDSLKGKKNTTNDKESKEKEEKVFLGEDKSVLNEVESVNKGFEEVETTVGKDVFGEVKNFDEEAEKINIIEKVVSENSGEDVVDGMLYKNLDTVLHESMIPYSEHVILDRAIPRVEDGLKPVQRRILYSMLELGVTPDKPFRKSARIVGDCLGKYHPHGDSSVYDAMVRLAQPFNTNMILVEGHGNFGSIDGDGAAAMRYTEARLSPFAMELLRDLDKNTIKWGLNFDDTLKEPEILPGRFPNLLVNGTTGIAVGLATNIPPHNLSEVIDGVVAFIDNPKITLKEVMKHIKGPDFPTGGYILSTSELKTAYETGRGKLYLRAKVHVEDYNQDKKCIVIDELPYQVNKSTLLQRINTLKDEDKDGLGVIAEVRDESDRAGMRAVVRLKKEASVKKVFAALIKNTDLQVSFGVNMVAIANGKPKQMSLIDIISYYAEYQREIVLRRSKYDLEQAKEREHILSGLIIAIKNIDAVVKIIKTSKNTTEAKARLRQKFVLSEKQAQAILDMRLARLTSLEVNKLQEEIKGLRELIKKLTAIIGSQKLQFNVVKEELLQIKKTYKQDRKTKILKDDDTLQHAEDEAQAVIESQSQNVVIFKTAQNNFKCVLEKQFALGVKNLTEVSTLNDVIMLKHFTNQTKTILAFSNFGNCFKIEAKEFGLGRFRDKGINERLLFKELANNESIVAMFDFDITISKDKFIMLSKFGMIKKTETAEYALLKKYFAGMKLKEKDELVNVMLESKLGDNYNFVFVSSSGMVLKAENKDVPLQGRVSGGVKGINISDKEFCTLATACQDEGEILLLTSNGLAKRVVLAGIDKMVRYRRGLKILQTDGGAAVVFADVVTNPYEIVAVCESGEIKTKNSDLISVEQRTGKGKPFDKQTKSLKIKAAFGNLK